MGALIATHAFGENDPAVVHAVVESLPFAVSRYAHSEYETVLSLRLKAELNRVAPAGTPRHFVVNTGAEAVENAIKAALLNRVMTSEERDGGFIVSFEGAFHGRTLGSLAATHRKKARLGFPTFDWPHILFPAEEAGLGMTTARFMRKLRLLTRSYDVPLIFDEVQTGWGMAVRLWAHVLFDLPSPPDLVTWAKKAQNGVLFISEDLATFFQEEKKFNTTWEGDSVGMVRLLALLDKLDLDQVRRTGERARAGLEALARDYREIVMNVRGE